MLLRVLLVVALVVTLTACGEGAASSAAGEAAPIGGQANDMSDGGGASSSSSSSSSSSTSSSSSGATCAPGSKAGAAGDEEITITSGGIEREATVHVPPASDGSRALPIVLILHPLLLTRKDMRKLVKAERFSDDAEHPFLAVYPDGIGRSWNAGECCGKAKDQKLDDVGFIHDLLKTIDAKWCVDKTRLFAMGFSNGAFLSHRLACQLEGDFTLRAIVPVAGTLGIPEADCKPANKTAVLAMHGTNDELVPYAGGPPQIPLGASFGTFVSPAATDTYWAKTNGCQPEPSAPYFTQGEVSCVRHDGCVSDASVALCTVTGGGHQWPGSTSLPAMGHLTMDIDATVAAIDLFKAHGL